MLNPLRRALLFGLTMTLPTVSAALAAPPRVSWTFVREDASIPSPVATDASRTYIIERQHLQARRLADGRLLWQAGTRLGSTLTLERGVIYVVGQARELHAFDAVSGRPIWTIKLTGVPEPATSGWATTLSVNDGLVLVTSTRGIWGVDARTGQQRWFREQLDARGPLAHAGPVAVWQLSTPLSTFTVGLDVQTGRERWRVLTGSVPLLQEDGHLFMTVPGSTSAYRMIEVRSGRSVRVDHTFPPQQASTPQLRFGAPAELFMTATDFCVRRTTGTVDEVNCTQRRQGQRTGGEAELLPVARGEQPVQIRQLPNATLPYGCAGAVFRTAEGSTLADAWSVTRTRLAQLPPRDFACFFPVSKTFKVIPAGGQLTAVNGLGRQLWSVKVPGQVQQVIPVTQGTLVVTKTELRLLALP